MNYAKANRWMESAPKILAGVLLLAGVVVIALQSIRAPKTAREQIYAQAVTTEVFRQGWRKGHALAVDGGQKMTALPAENFLAQMASNHRDQAQIPASDGEEWQRGFVAGFKAGFSDARK